MRDQNLDRSHRVVKLNDGFPSDLRKELGLTIGEVPEVYKRMQTYAPDSLKGVSLIRKGALTEGVLPKKVKELIIIAVEAALRLPPEHHAKWHARAAVKAGATPEEVHEAVEVALMVGGVSSYADYGHHAVKFAEQFQSEFSNGKSSASLRRSKRIRHSGTKEE
jgi:alkylhydroperoxidase/carboxymuconolactone decarboxylase family protein YurZ